MKKGDKVVCIDNYFDNYTRKVYGDSFSLEKFKVYNIEDVLILTSEIVKLYDNDHNWYVASRFIPLKKYRLKKIKKLNSNILKSND